MVPGIPFFSLYFVMLLRFSVNLGSYTWQSLRHHKISRRGENNWLLDIFLNPDPDSCWIRDQGEGFLWPKRNIDRYVFLNPYKGHSDYRRSLRSNGEIFKHETSSFPFFGDSFVMLGSGSNPDPDSKHFFFLLTRSSRAFASSLKFDYYGNRIR